MSQRAARILAKVPLALRKLVTVASAVILAGTSNHHAKPKLKKDRDPLLNDRPHKFFRLKTLRSGTLPAGEYQRITACQVPNNAVELPSGSSESSQRVVLTLHRIHRMMRHALAPGAPERLHVCRETQRYANVPLKIRISRCNQHTLGPQQCRSFFSRAMRL